MNKYARALLRERDDLNRRLAESEAGAAALRIALHRFHRHSDGLGTYPCSTTECVAAMALSSNAGSDFLAAAQKCRAGAAVMRAYVEHYNPKGLCGEAMQYAWEDCLDGTAGRDFLAAARQCRDAILMQLKRESGEFHIPSGSAKAICDEALAAIEQFMGDETP